MNILEDTRNKPGKHDLKGAYFAENGITVYRTKLFVGDYTLPTDQRICIDTKEDINELCTDVCQQHERFRAELIRAQENGIHLIILVENTDGVKTVYDLERWKNPRRRYNSSAISGERLYHVIRTMSIKYGAEFQFCTPSESGRRIIEILGGQNGRVDKT